MKIRLHDKVLCQHVRPISAESMQEDFLYGLSHSGEWNPAAYPYIEFRMDTPEKVCPDCGKIWRINI